MKWLESLWVTCTFAQLKLQKVFSVTSIEKLKVYKVPTWTCLLSQNGFVWFSLFCWGMWHKKSRSSFSFFLLCHLRLPVLVLLSWCWGRRKAGNGVGEKGKTITLIWKMNGNYQTICRKYNDNHYLIRWHSSVLEIYEHDEGQLNKNLNYISRFPACFPSHANSQRKSVAASASFLNCTLSGEKKNCLTFSLSKWSAVELFMLVRVLICVPLLLGTSMVSRSCSSQKCLKGMYCVSKKCSVQYNCLLDASFYLIEEIYR